VRLPNRRQRDVALALIAFFFPSLRFALVTLSLCSWLALQGSSSGPCGRQHRGQWHFTVKNSSAITRRPLF
jgi:hypothetical protein